MAGRSIRLSASQTDDIVAICSLGPDSLGRIASVIDSAPITIRTSKIEGLVAATAGSASAERLCRVLFGLATAMRRNFVGASALLDDVSDFLETRWEKDEAKDEKLKKWRDCRPPLEMLLKTKSIVLATKAMDVSFDVERFCVGARIITDIRPVFDEPQNVIVGSTIRQTLRMEYMSIDGSTTTISIGLDANDIAHLQDACKQALHKTEVAQKKLEESGLPETVIPGEDF